MPDYLKTLNARNLLFAALKTSPHSLYQYWKSSRLRRAARTASCVYQQSHSVRKLHIGCGGETLAGWFNTDLVPYQKSIAFLDASQAFPLSDGSFDYVYSEHVFEHLNFSGQANYLREALRILRPGGRIRIATPDFDFLWRVVNGKRSDLESRYLAWNFDAFLSKAGRIWRDAENLEVYVVNNYFRDWGHQLIHNRNSLSALMGQFGFSGVAFREVGRSEDPVLCGLERHSKMITEEFNRLETMVIEAEKPRGHGATS